LNILYLDCGMGAACDMLVAALLELQSDPKKALTEWNALRPESARLATKTVRRFGTIGTQLLPAAWGTEERHVHTDFAAISEAIDRIPVSDAVRTDARAIYRRLAEAEARVHGVSFEAVQFHEVGRMGAVERITAFCWLMQRIAPEETIVSPIRVGFGTVRCAHGILPVPAPATAELLAGCPTFAGEYEGELCTPTGAAMLTYYADRFGSMPAMQPRFAGYGIGTKELPALGAVHAVLGTK
jgi:uncharacterized protein (DUF111 family)